MKRKLMLLLSCLFIGIGLATAQVQKISGLVVSEEDGQPIIGASILVKGTTVGTITDIDGKFTLPNVPKSAKLLQISYIGMQTLEVGVTPNLSVKLKSDAQSLEEVVVVAYGTASKQSITGSVTSINSKALETRPVTSATSAIEGTAPGIQVNNSYGEPGSNKENIRIRGFGSINGTNAPLIVVDGVPYNGNMTDINSNDIESISVLKDAASAALYGNKAANGVILVTTKKGKSDKLNIRASIQQGIYNRAIPQYDHLGVKDWMETMRIGYKRYLMVDGKDTNGQKYDDATASRLASSNLMSVLKSNIFDKSDSELFDANGKLVAKVNPGYTDLDWMGELERNGHRQEYSLSADTGGEKYDLFASFSYLDEKGYIITSDFNRFTGRLNANFKPTKWFKAGINLSTTMSDSNFANSAKGTSFINPFNTAGNMGPIYPYYKHDGNGKIAVDENGQPIYNLNNTDYLDKRNIIYELRNDVNNSNRNAINGQIYGTVNFLKDFSFTIKSDVYNVNQIQKKYNNPICGDGEPNAGRLSKTNSHVFDYRFAQELYWAREFQNHHIDILGAHEAFKHTDSYDYFMKEKQQILGDNIEASNFSKLTSATGAKDMYTTESYLSRARYNYNQKYYVDASFRYDGSSRFYSPWGRFWSIGGSWAVSEEQFMKKYDWVNSLKLRAAYGEVGNDAGVEYYAYKSLYYADTNSGLGAYYKLQNPNEKLKWEKSATLDIALEGRLFNRFNFSLDFFNKQSKDLLFKVYNPLSAGATDWLGSSASGMPTVFKNIGSVRNLGLEVAMDVDVINQKDLRWNVGLNLTTINNEITKLPDGKDILSGINNYSEGHSIYEFYTYTFAGVDKLTGRSLYNADPSKVTDKLKASGDVITINDNGTEKYYVYNNAYAQKDWQGSALPDIFGSINSSLTWKDLTLSVLCTYSLGGKVYDFNYQDIMTTSMAGPRALHPDVLNAWKQKPEENIAADSPDRIAPHALPAFDLSSYDSYSQGASSRWLTSASYFVVKNINLSYNFPEKITKQLGLGGLNIFGAVENAATFTSRKGLNPQYSFNGSQDNTFVAARVYSFGLNLRF